MINLVRIKERIKANGWSESEFLRRIGMSTSSMHDWRAGKSSPEKHLPQIAQVLGTTEAYLRGETESPLPDGQKPLRQSLQRLLWEAEDLTEEEIQDVLEFVRFQKAKRK